jgi:UDP-glucose 4-epimerase
MRTVLVTGGAGYIGSHAVVALRAAGHRVVVADDLSGGHREAVPEGVTLEVGDVTAPGWLDAVAARHGAQAIMHFAARIEVGESVASPELYYATNVGGMVRVCEVASARRLPVVFSSTAAVYGEPEAVPIGVTHPRRPGNPYGRSKWLGEQMLADCGRAHGFGWAALRYFNAAGADAAGGLAERHDPETHLVPLAIDAALGLRPELKVFGSDWPTPDGTCLRDYVHVIDLADAHVRALARLFAGAAALTVNLGGGRGTSVREILVAVGRAVGRPVPHQMAARRPGDVAVLVADVSAARAELGWQPRRSLDEIIADAVTSRRDRARACP